MTTRVAVCLVVVVLLGAVPAGVVGVSTTAPESGPSGVAPSIAPTVSGDSTSLAGENDVLHRTTELRQRPAQPGTFETTMTFDVPEPMTGLEVDLGSEADVRAAEGFEATGEGTYRWTESTDEPSIRFSMPANRTGTVDGHAQTRATDGQEQHGSATATVTTPTQERGYTFIETGEWGIVQVPSVGLSFRTTTPGPIGIEETVTVDGPGVAGSKMAVFGPVTEHERSVDGETIRLAVPDAADLHERPAAVLDALEAANQRLDVGSSPAETLIIAAPSDVDWGPRGLQYGPTDAWVVADAPLEEATNVWLHEYVHVRQRFANPNVGTTADSEWLVEAQAEYYAGLLAYEQGLVSFDEFNRFLERGTESPAADGVLADPTTWGEDNTNYLKGALVYGELDRQVRLATDGDRSLDDVFRSLNAQDEQVSEADVLAALETVGNAEIRDHAERYTRTTETPELWNRVEHSAAFDQSGATIEYGLGSAPITVGDQPWERWDRSDIDGLDDRWDPDSGTDRGVLAVPAGERVTVPVTMENVDERAGTADVSLQAGGEIVDGTQRHLESGERATETLSWTPTEPGVYDVRLGSDRLTVVVRSASSLTVTELAVTPDSVEPGEAVTVTATVTASGNRPAAGTLEFRTSVETATGQPIALAPGETGLVEVQLRFDDEGRYEVAAGGQSATVTVGGALEGLESIPGFGVIAGGVALAMALAVALLGRQR
ncbi:hypothetical protein [Natronorubrum thiooxidans]|uniref:CARDB protein n=1 Tax=Natronorubrum thiooxidans TaxID=308853 RepID=A0A1N7GCC1_9EURY|nr:hypothetical protein [Natronorubrum thiooxidans]SIS10180.1 hypothetical protein SAMN05421752_11128 [Natronorubrum thiooxidans]